MVPSHQLRAFSPPPGQSSDYVELVPPVKGGIVCVAICLSITTALFILRIWARLGVFKQWILEDHMCCVSYIGFIIYFAFMTVAIERCGRVQKWDPPSREAYSAIYWSYAASIADAPAMLCTKLTALLLYRRIFLPPRWSIFDVILRMFMTISCLYYISTIVIRTWECTPRAKIWNNSIEGSCISAASLINTDGVFNTISDILLLLLPVKALRKLQMRTKKKLGIALIFTVGLVAITCSLVGWIIRAQNSSTPEETYHDPKILFLAGAELSAGLVCVCLPSIPMLLHCQSPSSPGSKSLERRSHPCHLRAFPRRQPSNISDQESLNQGNSGFRGGIPEGWAIESLPTAIVTAIEGGSPRGIRDIGPVDLEAKDDEFIQRPAIMKTVVVEQSSGHSS